MAQGLAVEFVGRADFDHRHRVESVEVGDGKFVDAIDHRRVMRGDCVEPSAAARPAGGRAEFAAHPVEHVAERVIFGGERSFTNARGVSFHHADDGVHAVRRHTRPGAGASGRGIRAGDKRIRSVVDVEVCALRAFKEQAFAAGHGVV